ncbi:MAG: flagellar basal body rod protein FlgC [Bacillota bacterium]
MFHLLNVSGSALTAGRLRMDVAANNIANVETTQTAEGGPYQRRTVLLTAGTGGFDSVLRAQIARLPVSGFRGDLAGESEAGVRVARIVRDNSPSDLRHEPGHPHADEDGYVAYPNVDLVREMTDLLMASRAYGANVTAFNVNKNMLSSTLRMGR